jgi:NTP pyrophosphatase (non-canonical NTP hydrolase)
MDQIIYYLYHIPGKKIGVTRNLKSRLTVQQGYQPSEYEVLESSNDIDYISDREAELQLIYGYKVDRDCYKELMSKLKLNKNMKLNVTDQTVTFPCPVNKLKGQLMDSLGLTFKTQYGNYVLTHELVDWITKNAVESMFNINRSFIYNKALSNYVESSNKPNNVEIPTDVADLRRQLNEMLAQAFWSNEVTQERASRPQNNEVPNVYDLIRGWANDKGIYKSGDSKTQYVKLMEESGELARAILKRDKPEIKDAIGDMIVVLTNLAYLEGFEVEDCVASAYDVIKSRQGKMVNGTFVKEVNDHLKSTL